MQINIRGQGITITPSRREHIESGLETTIHKYFPDALNADVNLSKEGANVKADINVKASKQNFVQGSSVSADSLAAFDLALVHIGKQLRRYKRHLNNHHKNNIELELEFQPATQYVLSSELEGDGDEAGDEPIIVAEMPAEIPKLTVSQAVMKMDLEALPVLMFVNRAHDNVNVVYRRADGNLGWIDPKIKQ
ncbi:MAG: ribosome hibernation-promoting factor, HPF/YfiA family [Alphaproteobacteria bacterium]